MRYLWILAFWSVSAVAAVNDRVGLFSPDAVNQAEALINVLDVAFDEKIAVEVFKEAPSPNAAAWAVQNAPDVNGVYVVISREPRHLEVAIRKSNYFTVADRDHMADLLLTSFRQNNFDSGLLTMLDFAQSAAASRNVTVVADVVKPLTLKESRTGSAFLWAMFIGVIALIVYVALKLLFGAPKPKPRVAALPKPIPFPTQPKFTTLHDTIQARPPPPPLPKATNLGAALTGAAVGAAAVAVASASTTTTKESKKKESRKDEVSNSSSPTPSYDSSSSSSYDSGSSSSYDSGSSSGGGSYDGGSSSSSGGSSGGDY